MATRLGLLTANDSSVALRGLLWKTLEDHPRILLLDNIAEAVLQVYRFFEKVLYVPGITLIARSSRIRNRRSSTHILEPSVGHLATTAK